MVKGATMKHLYLPALSAAVLLSVAAYAQQPTTTTEPAKSQPRTASSMPHDCGKAMDRMASADKAATPMKAEDCDKAAPSVAAKSTKREKRHNHAQFHKGSS
jgi:septal ring-binding cell division protein DamX